MKDYELECFVEKLNKSNVRFISGKWFDKDDNEIKLINRYIAKVTGKFNPKDITNIMDSFIMIYGDMSGSWCKLPIVRKALELGELKKDTKLPFDLDEKQLIIINRLLFHPEDEIMFICTGVGGSGKSTFLNIVKQLFDNDVSAATLTDLGNSFIVAQAIEHRLIASDELAKGELNNANLKTLISKQQVTANHKGRIPYDVRSQSALFFCCNNPPKIDITDTGILRRIVYYSRNTKIENPDKSLNKREYKQDELLTIARVALSYNSLENDSWFDYFKEETHKNLISNNSVYIYFNSDDYNESYSSYKIYCLDKNLKPYSEPTYESILELIKEWNTDICKTNIEEDIF